MKETQKNKTLLKTISNWFGAVLCVLFVVAASFRDSGVLGPNASVWLFVLLLAIGFAWILQGKDKWRRFGEMYLWLSFILSLLLLKILAEGLAPEFGTDWLTLFRILAILHLFMVGIALWILNRQPSKPSSTASTLFRPVANILVIGAVVFWIGARTFPGSSLEEISTNIAGHLWTAVNFAIATLLTLVGLVLLCIALHRRGATISAFLGLFSFSFGAVFWMLHLLLRVTVVRNAAKEFATTGAVPNWFEPWSDWIGLLFVVYSVLAYLGIAAFGVAFLKSRFQPKWVGWACIGFGILAAPLAGPPFFIHTIFWVIGILILRSPNPFKDNASRTDAQDAG